MRRLSAAEGQMQIGQRHCRKRQFPHGVSPTEPCHPRETP
jgi:hypothetical protein